MNPPEAGKQDHEVPECWSVLLRRGFGGQDGVLESNGESKFKSTISRPLRRDFPRGGSLEETRQMASREKPSLKNGAASPCSARGQGIRG